MKNSIKKAYVYLIADHNNDSIFKIGVTRNDLYKRIKQLQTGNSGDLYIFDYFEAKYPFYVERKMHFKYNISNVKGEWFELPIEEAIKFKEYCKIIEDEGESLKDNPFVAKNLK